MATSWKMPTFRPLAVADIHRPIGTKLKKMERNIIIATIIMRVITN